MPFNRRLLSVCRRSRREARRFARQLGLGVLCGLVLPWATSGAQTPLPVGRVALLIPTLSAPDEGTRSRAQADLLAIGPPAVAPLIEVFSERHRAEKTLRQSVAAMLPRFGPAVLIELSDAGGRDYSAPPNHRPMWDAAVAAAVDMGPPAIPGLIEMLQGPNVGTRRVFAESALGRLGPSAAGALAPLLSHPDPDIRHPAARALAQHPTAEVRMDLVRGLGSPDPDVRGSCAMGLVNLGEPRDAETFLGLSQDPAEYVRAIAAAGLEKTYRPEHRLPLARLACCDDSPVVRASASHVLSDINDGKANRLGVRYAPVRMAGFVTPALVLRYAFGLLLAGGLLGLIGVGTLSQQTEWIGSFRLPVGAVAAALIGLVWGGPLPHIVRSVELAFMLALLPVVCAVGMAVIRTMPHRRNERTRAWIGVIASCYAGFGFGWLWLWGYLGV